MFKSAEPLEALVDESHGERPAIMQETIASQLVMLLWSPHLQQDVGSTELTAGYNNCGHWVRV